jgi:alpha-beta hydrolase superfamily lysophospholipase
MIGGGELYAEELYFWTGAVAKRRGYNMLQIALPAQPAGAIQGVDARKLVERYGVNGMIQRAVRAYTDYLTSRPDVDAERIVAYGISGGGYYIMAAAADNPHLSAIVASTPIIDMHKIVESEWPPVLRKVPSFLSNAILGVAARVNPVARVLLQKILWAGGTNSVGEYIQLTKGETEVDAREITIPVLCMAAAGDPKECIRQTHETYDLLPNPKKAKHIFSPETGADAHCHVNNLILANQIIFDWFDAVLN